MRILVFLSLVLLARPFMHHGQCLSGQVFAADAQAGDGFGDFLALSGGVAIVGAQFEDDVATDAGAAYAFRRTGVGLWVPTGKLLAGDGAAQDHFGFPVAVYGTTALVGAQKDDDMGIDSGSAYVFEQIAGSWVETVKLTAPDGAAGDNFAKSAAVWGDHAVVGAVHDDPWGSVYVFERLHTGDWTFQQKLIPSGESADFGFRVLVHEDLIVVGAPGDYDQGPDSGAVYVFDRTPEGWIETAKVTPLDSSAGDYFGRSISLDGNTLLVGADKDAHAGVNSGSAYVFERAEDLSWTQISKLTAGDAQAGDSFGVSVAVWGDVAAVGADEEDAAGIGAGALYIFERSADTWIETGKLVAKGVSADDHFGYPVRIADGYMLVGARNDDAFGTNSGTVYIYDLGGKKGITACPSQISLTPGGVQQFDLSAGAEHALQLYMLAGSASGSAPGLLLGSVSLPLNPDPYFYHAINHPNHPPLNDSVGFLDLDGRAQAAFVVPAGTFPSLAGVTWHHAFVAWDIFGALGATFASDAVPITFVP
jgi:hypothetical protein